MITRLLIIALLIIPLGRLHAITEIEMKSNEVNKITIAWKNEATENILAVIRKAEHKLIPPAKDKEYKADRNLNKLTNNAITGDNCFVVYIGNEKSPTITVTNLSPNTDYKVTFYTINKKRISYTQKSESTFATLAFEPSNGAGDIAFTLPRKKDKIDLIYMRGSGQYCVVLCSEEKIPQYPADGTVLKANSKYGAPESRVGDSKTYVVYSGNENKASVEGLKPGTEYYFAVLEVSGKGMSANFRYPDDPNNPRSTVTALEPPVALEATEVSEEHFIANWKKVKYALRYHIDVATDKNFRNMLPGFTNLDVGEYDSWLIFNLEPKTEYYYRVRAITKYGPTENSNVISVKTR